MRAFVKDEFANHRGLIRTALADVMWRLGPYRQYGHVSWQEVRRVVFVCQGNICRSPFAHHLAQVYGLELPILSIGLATTTGAPADSTAIDVAADYEVNLKSHAATDIADFDLQDGDLFMVMEDRHIDRLREQVDCSNIQIGLLGLWCRPRFALIYDLHHQSREYFMSCFSRIDRAVKSLTLEYRNYTRG